MAPVLCQLLHRPKIFEAGFFWIIHGCINLQISRKSLIFWTTWTVGCQKFIQYIRMLQCLAKTCIYLTPYACTERIFDSRPFMYYYVIFLKKLFHIFTLLLAPFASKLANFWRHSETLSFQKNSKSTTISFKNSNLAIFKHFLKDSLCLE